MVRMKSRRPPACRSVSRNRSPAATGFREITLRAEPTDVVWGDTTRYAYTYNGSSPGPTLRLRRGDRLVVHLGNGLADDTNLHTHGLHVAPSCDGDNIFVRVRPGETRTYIYDIPSDHRSGLFWYHPTPMAPLPSRSPPVSPARLPLSTTSTRSLAPPSGSGSCQIHR